MSVMGRMDDDRMLFVVDVCALAGIKRQTWEAYVRRGLPVHNPAPQHEDVVIDRGSARKRWRESAVRAWMAARPGSPGRPRDDR
jgi:predicted DNA-binding transcriptional regulator AlpA